MKGVINMKGKDIISYIHRDKMPDIQQVRNQCIQQEIGKAKINMGRLRWSTAAAVLAVFLILSTTVYAAVLIYQRLDTRGMTEYVAMSAEDYQAWLSGLLHSNALYISPSGVQRFTNFWGPSDRPLATWHLDSAVAQQVNMMLEGRVFTNQGEPFQLMTETQAGLTTLYAADDRGYTLYCHDGKEIDTIRLWITGDGSPYRVDIYNVGDLCDRFGYTYTREDALQLMSGLRFPDVYGLDEPLFRVYYIPGEYLTCFHCRGEMLPTIRRVVMRYRYVGQCWDSAFVISVEYQRADDANTCSQCIGLRETPIFEGRFREHIIAGTVVHEVIERRRTVRFVWQHDGLVYTLIPLDADFEQSMEAICRMVEPPANPDKS